MKQLSVLLICLLVLCCSPAAFAADKENVLPATSSTNFASYSSTIGTTPNYIVCKSSSVLVKPGSQSLTMYLQKWNGSSWVTVDSWSTSGKSLDVDLSKNYPISSGKYRVKGKHSAGGETKYSYSPTKTI